ncbi:MAG: hypothetical protein MJ137_06360, partial [Clostridia bacterium]|nr:hypothetical protein [Clostridia bacterium]
MDDEVKKAEGSPAEEAEGVSADITPPAKRKQANALKAEARKRKKETARLRREYLARKKKVPQNKKPIVCPPDSAGKSAGRIAAGFACRAAVILFAVFALVFFLTDALGLAGPNGENFGAGMIFGWTALFTAVFSLSATVKPRVPAAAAGAVISLGAVAARLLPNPADSIVTGFKATFNAAMDHMTKVGYLAMGEKKLPLGESAAARTPEYIRLYVFLLIFALSALFTLCLIRRIRIWQLAAAGTVSAAILWLVFTYNISRSNWGTVLIIASFSALIVMFAFDTVYIRETGADKNDIDSANAAFNPEKGPEVPKSLLEKKRKAEQTAERKKEKRLARKKKKTEKRVKTVDEEISDYFAVRPAKPAKEKKHKLTKAEKAALTEEKKRIKAEKKKERRAVAEYVGFGRLCIDAKAATGGFAGIGMFILAMVMLFIPALATHDSFRTVDAIDKKFDYVREYVTAILMGDDPALDLLSYENNKGNFADHPTEPHAIYYTGKEVMKVETNTRYNIYLRGWIGTSYNDATGSWQTPAPGSDTLNLYRSLFGTTGSSVTDPAEYMMYSFYTLFDPDAIPSPDSRDYSTKINSHTTDGYVVAQVNMKRAELSSKLLYMPSFYLRSCSVLQKTSAGKLSYFMRGYGTGEASNITYANYFDGIYTSYRAAKDKD